MKDKHELLTFINAFLTDRNHTEESLNSLTADVFRLANNVLTAEDIDGSKIAHVYLDMTTVDKVDAYVKGSNARLAKLLK